MNECVASVVWVKTTEDYAAFDNKDFEAGRGLGYQEAASIASEMGARDVAQRLFKMAKESLKKAKGVSTHAESGDSFEVDYQGSVDDVVPNRFGQVVLK